MLHALCFHISDSTTWRHARPKQQAVIGDPPWNMRSLCTCKPRSPLTMPILHEHMQKTPSKKPAFHMAFLKEWPGGSGWFPISDATSFLTFVSSNLCLLPDTNFTAIAKHQERPSWNTSWVSAPLHSTASTFFSAELCPCEKLETSVWNYGKLLKSYNWPKKLNPHPVCSLTFYIRSVVWVFLGK